MMYADQLPPDLSQPVDHKLDSTPYGEKFGMQKGDDVMMMQGFVHSFQNYTVVFPLMVPVSAGQHSNMVTNVGQSCMVTNKSSN